MTGEALNLSFFSTSSMGQFEIMCFYGTLDFPSPFINLQENYSFDQILAVDKEKEKGDEERKRDLEREIETER